MKIAMVSSWDVKCGIATYTKDLALALAQEDVETFIVRLPRFGQKNPEIMVDIAERIPIKDVDLIHIQHEYGLYQNCEPAFYNRIRQYGKPIVTTMHAVGNFEIDILVNAISKKLIVHNEFCKKRMPYPNVVVIPHGVTKAEPALRAEAKSMMHIEPNTPVVGYLGFISTYKGLETLMEAMIDVKAGLMICGGWHTRGQDTEYIDRLKKYGDKLLPNKIVWKGYIEEENLPYAYGAMDVMVYPSRWVTESGALLHGIAYGRAIIANDLEPNREKADESALVIFKDVADLTEKINYLLRNEAARQAVQKGALAYAEKHSWTNVAKQHVELYNALLEPLHV